MPKTRPQAIVYTILGPLLALPSIWVLFVKLDVLRVPGLIKHFPQVYVFLAALVISGLFFFVSGVARLAAESSKPPHQ